MSSSEHDTMSESSNTMDSSPRSFAVSSPYNSPTQQVPQLANCINVLSCAEDISMHVDNSNNRAAPSAVYLKIVEHPQDHFRFRYRSEMMGTHGCLLGRSNVNNKTKTHPSVVLVNYKGRALVRCSLVQVNSENEHPHQLLEEEHDRDISAEVGPEKGYEVRFPGMGIIHTAKKDVPTLLFNKYTELYGNKAINARQLRSKCENEAKNINLNIVRLKFTAHDLTTDLEICAPVFSEPIHNMKSAATNDLKICRMSRVTGRVEGGDDVYIFVEKVNKKNIDIRFVETTSTGETCWTAKGRFTQNDVHHQYAIIFKTPPYHNLSINNDVKVFVELARPSDGRTSERLNFTYKADFAHKQSKKRRIVNNSYSSLESSSGGSIRSNSDLPVSVANQSDNSNITYKTEQMLNFTATPNIPRVKLDPAAHSEPLAEALFTSALSPFALSSPHMPSPSPHIPLPTPSSSSLAPHIPFPTPSSSTSLAPHLTSTERELDRMLVDNTLPSGELKEFLDNFDSGDFRDAYLKEGHSLPDEEGDELSSQIGLFVSSLRLVADSGAKPTKPATPQIKPINIKVEEPTKPTTPNTYSALYKQEEGHEVKKVDMTDDVILTEDQDHPIMGLYYNLVKELCEIMRNKSPTKKMEVKAKLERLFDMRLNNGDTFLHMTLCTNILPSMEFIVNIISQLGMKRLLNLRNHKSQTILHLAILNDLSSHVAFLVNKGCDPMVEDNEGNNAVHYAVIHDCGLHALLSSTKQINGTLDLDASNNDNKTALHLAVEYNLPESCRLLIREGASCKAQDCSGRTPLHLAAYDHRLAVVQTMLPHIPSSEVDATDGRSSALQVVCGMPMHPHSYDIAKLLLEKGANPLKYEADNASAWKLAYNKPQLRTLIEKYLPSSFVTDIEIKSEPEDDSADEDVEALSSLPRYVHAVSAVLDASGRWRELAARLHCDQLLNWYEKTVSPTATLLSQVKELDEGITSQSLAMTLKDMGEEVAANIILQHLD